MCANNAGQHCTIVALCTVEMASNFIAHKVRVWVFFPSWNGMLSASTTNILHPQAHSIFLFWSASQVRIQQKHDHSPYGSALFKGREGEDALYSYYSLVFTFIVFAECGRSVGCCSCKSEMERSSVERSCSYHFRSAHNLDMVIKTDM